MRYFCYNPTEGKPTIVWRIADSGKVDFNADTHEWEDSTCDLKNFQAEKRIVEVTEAQVREFFPRAFSGQACEASQISLPQGKHSDLRIALDNQPKAE